MSNQITPNSGWVLPARSLFYLIKYTGCETELLINRLDESIGEGDTEDVQSRLESYISEGYPLPEDVWVFSEEDTSDGYFEADVMYVTFAASDLYKDGKPTPELLAMRGVGVNPEFRSWGRWG